MNNDPASTSVDISKLYRNKTENHIILKPIAERFNRIANEISDGEIRSIIKSEMRDQLKNVDFQYCVQEKIDEFLDINSDTIVELFKKSLEDRFR